jgi:hypothetical protein
VDGEEQSGVAGRREQHRRTVDLELDEAHAGTAVLTVSTSHSPPSPSRVWIPLPTITASARVASARVAWACGTTPFIDVTVSVGDAIEMRQPGAAARLRMPSAINESSSLKPSKVTIAIHPGELRRPRCELGPKAPSVAAISARGRSAGTEAR